MAKFTTIEDLIDEAYQSIVGGPPTDNRVELGTKTLDDRDYWENINFNENTFQPYLTGNLETLETEVRDGIVYRKNIETSVIYQYSVDALPFVTDPNNDNEIIKLDEYYDKKNNSTEYYLATEGKINYYLYARESGRPTPDGHIDNYSTRNTMNRFDSYAQNVGDTGFYLFKLNWGDGTEIEYTDNPKLLEGSVLLEHFYEKPGFYTISGVVYALFSPEDEQSIGGYERFETNILLNPSKNYEFNLYDYDNFATIGGISLDSTLIKSSLNTIGINPINPLDDQRASSENIEKLNLLDKLQLFNFLNKVSGSFLNKFQDLLEPDYYYEEDESVNEEEELDEDEELTTYTLSLSVDGHFANMYNPLGAISVDGGDPLFVPSEINFVQGTVVNLSTVTIGESDNAEVIFDGWLGDTDALSSDESPTTITMNNNYNISAKFEWLYTDIPTLEQPEHIPIDLDNMWFGSEGDTRPTAPNSLQTVNVANLNEPWFFNVRYIHDDNNPPDPFTMPWNWAAYVVWFSETDEEWKDIMLGYDEYVDGVSDTLIPGTRTITGGGVRDGNETPTNNWEWALDQVKNSTQPTEDIFYFIEVNDPATNQEIRSTLGRIEGLFE